MRGSGLTAKAGGLLLHLEDLEQKQTSELLMSQHDKLYNDYLRQKMDSLLMQGGNFVMLIQVHHQNSLRKKRVTNY